MTNEEIGDELVITRQKAGRRRVRYAVSRIDRSSQDASRSGRKPKVKNRLRYHERFHLHFTHTRASWLNMAERFFRELTRQLH